MIRVLRQLPRNSRIISPVRAAAMTASRITPEMAARTNTDWSLSASILSFGGSAARICGSFSLMLLMMSIVEALPVFSTFINTARLPSDADDVGLRRIAVAHMRDVADIGHRAVAARGSAGRSDPRCGSGWRSA